MWAKTVYDGLWFSPVREALDAFFAKTQELVTGEVRVRLQAGAPASSGAAPSTRSTRTTLASYGVEDAFPHDAAEGFIRLAAMEVELAAARERKVAPSRDALGRTRRRRARAARSGSSCKADDAELLPYDCAATLEHARRLHAARASSTPTSSRRSRRALAHIERARAGGRGRPLGDRAAARRGRPQDPRGPLAQRPGRGGVPALRARRVRRGRRGDPRVRDRRPRPRRGGGGDADARLHAPAARAARHGRAPPARVGGDARARPRRASPPPTPPQRRRRSARARSPGSTLPLPPPDGGRCATRSTPSPTATSRSTTSTRARCCSRTCRGSARSSSCGRRASSAS